MNRYEQGTGGDRAAHLQGVPLMRFTVTKHAKNRFEVSGVILVYRGTENYSRVFTTLRAAKADAAKWESIQIRIEADRVEELKVRRQNAAEYLAARANRPSKTQMSFSF